MQLERRRLILLFSLLFFIFVAACGRRGDPVAIEPYKEVGVVKDLKAITRNGNIYITWGLPDELFQGLELVFPGFFGRP